jgi:hypothetical protein
MKPFPSCSFTVPSVVDGSSNDYKGMPTLGLCSLPFGLARRNNWSFLLAVKEPGTRVRAQGCTIRPPTVLHVYAGSCGQESLPNAKMRTISTFGLFALCVACEGSKLACAVTGRKQIAARGADSFRADEH